jgi:hypothetical protein
VLLNRSTTLATGQRVRVRLPHGSDRGGLLALHARLGHAADAATITRLTAHDPRTRAVVCAVGWTSEGQSVLGLAAGDVGADGPDLLLLDTAAHPGLDRLLTAALAERTGPPFRRP